MMDGFGKEEEFADQPRIKILLDDGRELDLRGLAGVMITEDGDYTSILFGHYTLPKLAVIGRIFSDTIEEATDELVAEIQDEIRKDAKKAQEEGEEIEWQLVDIADLMPPDFDEVFKTKPKKIVPKTNNVKKPRPPKKDPLGMETWAVDKVDGDEYIPDVANEVEVFDGWYFDGKEFYQKKKK